MTKYEKLGYFTGCVESQRGTGELVIPDNEEPQNKEEKEWTR